MKKTILYRLFGFGSVPKKLLPVLEQEGVVVLDEGMRGWFVTKRVIMVQVKCIVTAQRGFLVAL